MKLSTSTEWLFFHLWKKNPETGTSCPGVFLVDTVIYRWAQPYFWYFTNRDGEIIRKTKERIDTEHVKETFMYNVPNSGVVAQYLVSQDTNQAGGQKNFAKDRPDGANNQNGGLEQEVIQFEYFDEDNFNVFLRQREKNLNAILQKFIQPKSGKNSLIKVSWSPQFCLLYRKTNVNTLDNTKVPIHEKLCTFEGPEYLAIQDSITSPILSADLEQMCVNIVKHIQDISGGNIQISRMVLYFKLDDRNRLWLLFCTGLKIRERFQDYNNTKKSSVTSQGDKMQAANQNQGMNPRTLSPVLRMSKTQHSLKHTTGALNINYGYIQNLQNNFKKNCSNCEVGTSDLYELKLSNIIESFEQGAVDNSKTILPQEILKLIEQNKAKKLRRLNQGKKKKNNGEQRALSKEEELKELFKYLDEEHQNNDIDLTVMPALIVKVWGNLTELNYQKIKTNKSWLQLTTKVCDTCYLDYTKSSLETDFIREAKINSDQLKNEVTYKEKMVFGEYGSSQGQKKQFNSLNANNKKSSIPSQSYLQSQKDSLYNLDSPISKNSSRANSPNTSSNVNSFSSTVNQQQQQQQQQQSNGDQKNIAQLKGGKKSTFFSDIRQSVPQNQLDDDQQLSSRSKSGNSKDNRSSHFNGQSNKFNINQNDHDHYNYDHDNDDIVARSSEDQEYNQNINNNAQLYKLADSNRNTQSIRLKTNDIQSNAIIKYKKKVKKIIKPSFYQDPQKIYQPTNFKMHTKLPSLRNNQGFNDSSSLSGSTQSKLSHDFLINTISSLKNSIKDIEEFNPDDYK